MLRNSHIFILYNSFAEETGAHGSSSSRSALTPSCPPSPIHIQPQLCIPWLFSLPDFLVGFFLQSYSGGSLFPSKLYFLASAHYFLLGVNARLAKDTSILAMSLSIRPMDFIAYPN